MSGFRSSPRQAQRGNSLLRLRDEWQGQEMRLTRETQSWDWRAWKLLRRKSWPQKLPEQAALSAPELKRKRKRKPELEPKRKAAAALPASPIRTAPKIATQALDSAQDSPTNLARRKS